MMEFSNVMRAAKKCLPSSGRRIYTNGALLHENEEMHRKHLDQVHKQQQLKDVNIARSLCRIMESQIWGPNTEPLLRPYAGDLTSDIVAHVVSKQKSLDMAKRFFFWSSQKIKLNAHAYHSLLIKLGQERQFDEMWKLLQDMKLKGCQVCGTAFSIILKSYSLAGLSHEALNVVQRAREFDVQLDVPMYTSLLAALFRGNMVNQARIIYKKMLEEKCNFDGTVWSILIRGFGNNGCTQEAEKCWEKMVNSGYKPDVIQYNAFIEGLCESKAIDKALSVLSSLQEKGIKPNAYSFNPILSALCKAGRFSDALSMFSSMKDTCFPNQATCNMLLEGLFLDKDFTKALQFYETMEKEGLLDSRSYFLVASGLRKAKQTKKLLSLSQELRAKHGVVNVWLCNAVLYCYCDELSINKAAAYFEDMLNGLTTPDLVSYATMISGYCKAEKMEEAMQLLCKMESSGPTPNAFCYTPLIAAVLKQNRVTDGLRLFEEMLRRGLQTNAVTCDFLLRKLSETDMVDECLWLCEHVLDKRFQLRQPTLSLVMDCLRKAGKHVKADTLWETLQYKGCLVDSRPLDKALSVLRGGKLVKPISRDCS